MDSMQDTGKSADQAAIEGYQRIMKLRLKQLYFPEGTPIQQRLFWGVSWALA